LRDAIGPDMDNACFALMTLEELLIRLGYHGSPHFRRRGDGCFESVPGYGHIFRHAEAKTKRGDQGWSVEGVYGLGDLASQPERFVPVVYVCKARDESDADELHRLVWNQDVVPYVVVHTPRGIKVYCGFHYESHADAGEQPGVLQAMTAFDQAQAIVDLFQAQAVDKGDLWKNPRLQMDPSRRVYHRLLHNLRDLDKWLRGPGELTKETSHALIGKYVYLRYLRDRDILSDKRLEEWRIEKASVFHRDATRAGLAAIAEKLEDWLNGEIFPLPLSGPNAPRNEHIQRVAATFAGDDIGESNWQLHFDFRAYDFSYIPIETLSLIYEQFLHAGDDELANARGKKPKSKGRKAEAYYTPLPLVNFMLAELEERLPLKRGMRVFDPSCGSGAFLVQAYRRLIEKTFPHGAAGPKPKPAELRDLLESGIFGVDLDRDACQVTQLSLALTLLDYVDPPDLTRYPSFQLPSLRENNILEGNFFELDPKLRAISGKEGFDWLVGNPPWKQLKTSDHAGHDQPVWDWMRRNTEKSPVGMYQTAQAFAWEAPCYLANNGECALLVPAMCLVEEPSEEFRKIFFRRYEVRVVANFANLAEVLFDGRSRLPAAAFFYRPRPDRAVGGHEESITTYSPFVANQEATRPLAMGERRELWNLVVNRGEIRSLGLSDVLTGSGLPWKLAMWGTPWDERLIQRLEKKWSSFEMLEEKGLVLVSEGPQLCMNAKRDYERETGEREEELATAEEATDLNFERKDDLFGQPVLDMNKLKRLRHVFSAPRSALTKNSRRYVCLIHGKSGLDVCHPPHIAVSASRNFAFYSDDYFIIPKTQLGIISPSEDKSFLKALALFLSSDFTFYHQFFRSTQMGLKRPVATLKALRRLPVPILNATRSELADWENLHAKLAGCSPRPLHPKTSKENQKSLFSEEHEDLKPLLQQLDNLSAQALGLDERERALIRDFVRVRFVLDDGQLGFEAVREPTDDELWTYGRRLKEDLDNFLDEAAGRLHHVTVVRAEESAMVEVDLTRDRQAGGKIRVLSATSDEAGKFRRTRERLLEERAQWVYFDRNLRIYRGHQTYLFKPLQRFHWTESAAMMDAGDLIAETLSPPVQ
jgi:hypothetical protein